MAFHVARVEHILRVHHIGLGIVVHLLICGVANRLVPRDEGGRLNRDGRVADQAEVWCVPLLGGERNIDRAPGFAGHPSLPGFLPKDLSVNLSLLGCASLPFCFHLLLNLCEVLGCESPAQGGRPCFPLSVG